MSKKSTRHRSSSASGRSRRTESIHLTHPVGSPPGVIEVDPNAPKPNIRILAYGPDDFVERTGSSVEILHEIPLLRERWKVLWIDVDGLGDAAVLEFLSQRLNVHRLAMEDVVHVHQRPKVEAYGQDLFLTARMLHMEHGFETEQVSLYLTQGVVLTFQEGIPGDCMEVIRQRIREGGGRIRQSEADYLLYSILDVIVDAYFPVLETYSEKLDALEDGLATATDHESLQRVHAVRRELLSIRRVIWPQREALHVLQREASPLIREETRIYFRDVYDHTVQIIDLLETYRELGAGLIELALSMASHRMNEIMKVLTIISTIFIPLSFVASLYGMNFDTARSHYNMPELEWQYGYPFVLVVMLMIAGGLVTFFRKKGWLSSLRPRPAVSGAGAHDVPEPEPSTPAA